MKTPRSFLALSLVTVAAPVFAATSAIPERRSAERYAKMSEDSPFALATKEVAAAEPVKGWASSLYVSGIGKNYIGGKEQIFVGIKSRGEQTSFSLFGNDAGYDGISIGGIEWSEQLGKSKVTLKKGTEFATVTFDPQIIATPASPVAPPRTPGTPGMRPQPGGVPASNVPRPPAGSAVPRPSAAPVLPQQLPAAAPSNTNTAPSNTNAAPPEGRQRVRVIKSTP